VRLGGRSRQVTLARASFRIGAGRTARLTLRLPRSRLALVGANRLARRAIAVARVGDAAGNRATVRRALQLLPPAS
jgi:hypothetical protein